MSICKICGGEYYKLRLHLRSHKIDPMDYYVKYISESHEHPRCANPACNKKIYTFTNDSWEMGPSKYCCKACMDADLPNVLSERHTQGVYEDSLNKMNSLMSYKHLLSDKDPNSIGYLYLIEIENDMLKIGATSINYNQYLNSRCCGYSYKILRVLQGKLIEVAKAEKLIKDDPNFKAYQFSGYVSSSEEYSKEIKDQLIKYFDELNELTKVQFD